MKAVGGGGKTGKGNGAILWKRIALGGGDRGRFERDTKEVKFTLVGMDRRLFRVLFFGIMSGCECCLEGDGDEWMRFCGLDRSIFSGRPLLLLLHRSKSLG
jgi:hypothetical protein